MSLIPCNGQQFNQARAELAGVVHTRENNDIQKGHVDELRDSLQRLQENINAVCASEVARMSESQASDRLYDLLVPLLVPDTKVNTTTLISEIVIRSRTVLDILPQSVRDRLGAALFSPNLSTALQKFMEEDLRPIDIKAGTGPDPFAQVQELTMAFRAALKSALDAVGTSSMVRDFTNLSDIANIIDERISRLKEMRDRLIVTEFRDEQIHLVTIVDGAITRTLSLSEKTTNTITVQVPQEAVQLKHQASPHPDELRVRQVFDDVLDSLPSPVFRADIIRTLLFNQVREPIESLVKSDGPWSAREHFSSALHSALNNHPEVAFSMKDALAIPMGVKDKSGNWSDSIEHLTGLIGRLSYFGLCDAIELRLSESRRRAALREVPAFVQMYERSKQLAEWFGSPVPGREQLGGFFRLLKETELHPIDSLAKKVSGLDSIDALLASNGIAPTKRITKNSFRRAKRRAYKPRAHS